MADLLTAFGVVFLAELGDKTQLVAMGMAARHRAGPVVVGVVAGYLVTSTISAVVGGVLGASLPTRPVGVAAGVLFVVFGLLALRGDDDVGPDTGVSPLPSDTWRVVGTTAAAIIIAELGDKTMIATASLAARSDPWLTWAGATVGIIGSGLVGVAFGNRVLSRIPDAVLRYVAAGLFVVVGVAVLIAAI